jgi:site-specific DNA recombinase
VDCLIYARISSDRGGEAVGVKRQVKDCLELVQTRGYRLAAEPFVDNNVSAYSGKPRPAYRSMAQLIESGGIGAIVVFHIDRLYRSPRELEDLIDLVAGSGLVVDPVNRDSTIDLSDTDGQLVARMVVAVARKSSDDARRRVVRWQEDRVAKGLPNGGGRRPYGLEWDEPAGTWKHRVAEATVVRRITRDLLRGRSASSIVRELNLEGVPTATGGRWSSTHVRRLMLNPTIAGLRVHRRTGTATPGNWPGLITLNQRELLLALFNDPTRPRFAKSPTARTRLLSGILVCARCGRKMYSNGSNGYVCSRTWGGCGRIRVASSPLEDWVTWEAVGHLGQLRRAGRVTEHDDIDVEDNQALIEERLRLQQRRDEWARKLALDEVDDHAYAVGIKAIDSRIEELQVTLAASIKQAAGSINDDGLDILPAPRVGQNWTSMLSSKELLDRYELLTQLIEKVVVSPASRQGARWEPERLTVHWRHPLP